MSKRRVSLVQQQNPKLKKTPVTSSSGTITTKGGDKEQTKPNKDLQEKHRAQCIELKKNIYDRWEKSIMSKNNFSPLVNRKDTPSSPCNNAASSLRQEAILPVEVTSTPCRDGSTNATTTTTTSPTNPILPSEDNLTMSPPSATVSKSPPPLSPNLAAGRTPLTPPSLTVGDAVTPILMSSSTNNNNNHSINKESVDARPLPSKSVRRDGELINKVGQKLEETLENMVPSVNSSREEKKDYDLDHKDEDNNNVVAESGPDGPATRGNGGTYGKDPVPSPMPLFKFLDAQVNATLQKDGLENATRNANATTATSGHEEVASMSRSGSGSLVQKPPSGPKPTVQRPSLSTTSSSSSSTMGTASITGTASTTSATATKASNKVVPKIPKPKTGINVPMIYPPPEHMRWVPEQPEVLHVARDRLVASMMEHDANRLLSQSLVKNLVVYDSIETPPAAAAPTTSNNPNDLSTTTSSSETIPAEGQLKPYYTLESPNDTTLIFESRFESGNLRRSIQVYENEYDLIVKPDINTRGHTQWFYFSVANTRKGVPVKFNLINMYKGDSLYNRGMKPLMYSAHDSSSSEIPKSARVGWRRCGTDVCYYQNHIKRKGGHYYTASFTITFPHDQDTVHLAYCYPYTYSDLQLYLKELEDDPKRRNRFRRRTMCQTLAGNNCDLLTITSFACDPEALRARKGVVVSARVHPGESNASHMMKGVIDYLTGPSLDAKILRDNFVFKIVPMLNPDGVIVGNYRCNLAGVDLNRTWDAPSRKLNPTIFYLKQMIRRFMDDRELILFCDLHGHSRKMNVFMYGCENKKTWSLRLRERVFPRMLWRNANVFSFSDCTFKVSKQKENAGRVVVWRELGLTNSYTMEASFCGADFGRFANLHFSVAEFEEMGHYFCDTILDYCDPDQSKVASTLRELQTLNPTTAGPAISGLSVDADDDSDEGETSDNTKEAPKKRGSRRSSRRSSLSSEKHSSNSNNSSSPSVGGSGKSRRSSSNQSSKDTKSGKSGSRRSNGNTDSSDSKQDKSSSKSSSKGSNKADAKVGSSGGGQDKPDKPKKRKSKAERRKAKAEKNRPLSVDEALAQADAALSAAVETRHLAGSGSAAVKARKQRSSSQGGSTRNDAHWRQSAAL